MSVIDQNVVVTGCPPVADEIRDTFADFGVATVHESQDRLGQFASYMRTIYPSAHIVGTAITVSMVPCDDWMPHVAVEQCPPGEVLVAAPTSPSNGGYFGNLLVNSLMPRSVRGRIIEPVCAT